MKKTIILLTCSLLACNSSQADDRAEIKAVNQKVVQIEKSKENLNVLELKIHTGELEAAPPNVMYYYRPENMELVMLQVSVGHEIFLTKYTYYFENNRVIKFLKDTEGHPEPPPKFAIIYKADGKVLWKNIDEPNVMAKTVLDLYKNNIAILKEFSKY